MRKKKVLPPTEAQIANSNSIQAFLTEKAQYLDNCIHRLKYPWKTNELVDTACLERSMQSLEQHIKEIRDKIK